MENKINFTGYFCHYQPVNFEPHYVFTTATKFWHFLIKCKDYPELMGELLPEDIVNIEAEKGSETDFGTTLINVRFGRL